MVAAGFTLRKIRTVQTLGEKLSRARKRKGVDLIEAELATKIRAKYLEALENEDFDLLPNDIYVKGFLSTYSRYLGLDPDKIQGLYAQLRSTSKESTDENFVTGRVVKEKTLIVTPKLVILSLGVLFCISAVIYIVFQVMSFASVPKLEVFSPSKDSVVEEEAVKVSGKTDIGVELKVNKEPIAVSSNGDFEREVTLQKGLNTIVITATNKANKEASQVFIVERKVKTARE
jgi:cytoskeletal protein RodZ